MAGTTSVIGSHIADSRIHGRVQRGAVGELCPLVGIADSDRRESKKSHGSDRGHGHRRSALEGKGLTKPRIHTRARTHTQTAQIVRIISRGEKIAATHRAGSAGAAVA